MMKLSDDQTVIFQIQHFLHRYFLPLLLTSYAVAGFFPGPGLAIRDVSLGRIAFLGETMKLGLPAAMLSFLLFSAGLGVKTEHLRSLGKRPVTLIAGLVANLLIPIAYIAVVSQVMRLWHDVDEVQNILVGLALVASMPIAGSSTAWTQNENGDLALSLGLVLGSTILSPITTPLAMHGVGFLAQGDYSEDLHELASGGTGGFLFVYVMAPSLLGITMRLILGASRVDPLKPAIKLLNSIVLLVLCYSNAAVSLPRAFADRDYDFLAVIFVIVFLLCVIAFGAGLAIARIARVDPSQRTALMFGLGMNNNGGGLVLASMALADHPLVMLPIIFYNLIQHLVAGGAATLARRRAAIDAERIEYVDMSDSVRVGPGDLNPPHKRHKVLEV